MTFSRSDRTNLRLKISVFEIFAVFNQCFRPMSLKEPSAPGGPTAQSPQGGAADPTLQENEMRTVERTALFIDGANLYATAKALGFDIDYKRLLKEFQTRGYLVR